jgi:hypothetical protein
MDACNALAKMTTTYKVFYAYPYFKIVRPSFAVNNKPVSLSAASAYTRS